MGLNPFDPMKLGIVAAYVKCIIANNGAIIEPQDTIALPNEPGPEMIEAWNSDKETEHRREAAIEKLLATPPKPHAKLKPSPKRKVKKRAT